MSLNINLIKKYRAETQLPVSFGIDKVVTGTQSPSYLRSVWHHHDHNFSVTQPPVAQKCVCLILVPQDLVIRGTWLVLMFVFISVFQFRKGAFCWHLKIWFCRQTTTTHLKYIIQNRISNSNIYYLSSKSNQSCTLVAKFRIKKEPLRFCDHLVFSIIEFCWLKNR